jgi:hypothetical protein
VPGRVVLEIGNLPLNPNNAELIQRSLYFGGDIENGIYFALREQIHASCLSWNDVRWKIGVRRQETEYRGRRRERNRGRITPFQQEGSLQVMGPAAPECSLHLAGELRTDISSLCLPIAVSATLARTLPCCPENRTGSAKGQNR